MKLISKILSANMRVVAGTYTLVCNGIQPLLQELSKDINNNTRKFTFLCGHDTTTTALLTALKVKDSTFSNTFTEFAPIGAKVVISKYKNKNGEEFCKLFHVYESTNQIRFGTVIDLDDGPVAYPLELEGLSKNQDGFYKLSDINMRFAEALKNGGM
ncbi:MAG: hypothetical protein Q4E88_03695 [Coriobacteriia bacterium]|nr:hypothetical protein [Coriobacteriia bacterium]